MVVRPRQVSLLPRLRGCVVVPYGAEGAVRLNDDMTPFEDDVGAVRVSMDTETLSGTCWWMRSGPRTPRVGAL